MRNRLSTPSLREMAPTRRTAHRRTVRVLNRTLASAVVAACTAVAVLFGTLLVAASIAALLSLLPAHPLTLVVAFAVTTVSLHALPLAALQAVRVASTW